METKIPGFENYTVTYEGFVHRRGKFVRPTVSGRKGYEYKSVQLWKDCKPYKRVLHKLVWTAFNGEVPEGYQVDHIDRDNMNNCLDNLRLVSVSENQLNKGFALTPDTYDYWQLKKKQEEDDFWWGVELRG